MPLLLRLVLNVAFLYVLTTPHHIYGQVPIPKIDSLYGIWPREIPLGSADTMLEVRGTGFIPESIIQLNGEDIPTRRNHLDSTEIVSLTGLIPESLLKVARAVEVRVLNPYGGASAPMTIEVKPRKQPARLEIELSTVWTGHQDQLDVVIRLTNLGPISFYVPTHITPLMGGNMLNSYHFEVRGPNDFVFTDPVHAFADGIFPKTTTEETLLQSGRIALVRPAETFSGKARFHVNGFSIRDETGRLVLVPGRYTARIRFDPQFPPGADKYKTKFLTEEVLSNEVVLNIN